MKYMLLYIVKDILSNFNLKFNKPVGNRDPLVSNTILL